MRDLRHGQRREAENLTEVPAEIKDQILWMPKYIMRARFLGEMTELTESVIGSVGAGKASSPTWSIRRLPESDYIYMRKARVDWFA